MIESTTLVADVKGEFEGGSSLSVEWDSLIRRAVENVLDGARPETLKRVVPLYGGISQNVYAFYCPPDVLVPSEIYSNDGARRYTYQPSKVFHTKNEYNKFTIEYINGKRFVVIRHNETSSTEEIDAMDSVGTKTGGSPALNQHNFLFGEGAVEATFDDTGTVEFGDTLEEALDISEYLRGILLVPAYLEDASKLESIELRLKTSDAAYIKVISTIDSIGDYFINGWNFVRFNLSSRQSVGAPDTANITEWSIVATAKTGEEITIIFDKITLQKSAPFYMEYYSNRAYISGTTGELWHPTIATANQDKINIDRDLAGVLHYELAMLVLQSTNLNGVQGQIGQLLQAQLSRKWENYHADHPSSAAPLTYNKSPEISRTSDVDSGVLHSGTESFASEI